MLLEVMPLLLKMSAIETLHETAGQQKASICWGTMPNQTKAQEGLD